MPVCLGGGWGSPNGTTIVSGVGEKGRKEVRTGGNEGGRGGDEGSLRKRETERERERERERQRDRDRERERETQREVIRSFGRRTRLCASILYRYIYIL